MNKCHQVVEYVYGITVTVEGHIAVAFKDNYKKEKVMVV